LLENNVRRSIGLEEEDFPVLESAIEVAVAHFDLGLLAVLIDFAARNMFDLAIIHLINDYRFYVHLTKKAFIGDFTQKVVFQRKQKRRRCTLAPSSSKIDR